MSDRFDFYELHARAKYGLPDNWHIYRWECFPKSADETLYIQVTGMVAPMRKDGKGRNWRRGDKTTKKECHLPVAEHAQWVRDWEKRTGLCSKCSGTGQKWIGWGVSTGHRYEPCKTCNSTGKTTL